MKTTMMIQYGTVSTNKEILADHCSGHRDRNRAQRRHDSRTSNVRVTITTTRIVLTISRTSKYSDIRNIPQRSTASDAATTKDDSKPKAANVAAPSADTTSRAASKSNIDIDNNPIYPAVGKPITQVNIDEDLPDNEKPWRKPGTDISDYFNYGFDEFTWALYAAKQDNIRGEFGADAFANNNKKMMDDFNQMMMMGGGGGAGGAGGMPGGGMEGMPPEMQQMMQQMMAGGMDPSQMDPSQMGAMFGGMQGQGGGQQGGQGQGFGGGYGQQGYGGYDQNMGGGGGGGRGGFGGGRGRRGRW